MVGTPELKQAAVCATTARAKTVLVGDAYQLAPVKARGGMFEQLCADLPWSQRLREVWRMRDPEERDTSLALRAASRQPAARRGRSGIATIAGCTAGDPIAMASDALDAYLNDRAANTDALLICDTWEMADALNHRLHDTLTTPGPTVKAARDQAIRVGDIIMSRSNDATIDVRPRPAPVGRADQVRNGNRWRVAALDTDTNRVAAERLTDKARAVFDADYLKEHVTLGYAATVHSAQGVTADSSYAILGEGASRAMAYVAMTRGRHNNEAFLYQKIGQEADHDHAKPISARGDPPAAPRQQILGRALLQTDPAQRRPAPHHACRSRTHRTSRASRGGRRGDSTPRGTPPRPHGRVAGAREDGAGVASR